MPQQLKRSLYRTNFFTFLRGGAVLGVCGYQAYQNARQESPFIALLWIFLGGILVSEPAVEHLTYEEDK
jgi:hypothetical protein